MYCFIENSLSKKAKRVKIGLNYDYINFVIGNDEFGNPNFNMIQRLEAVSERFPKNCWEYLGISETEGFLFSKWYNRRVIPYCKNNGIFIKDYPINAILLLEIVKLDTNIEEVIDYFEYFCKYGYGVSLEFLNEISKIYKPKETSFNNEILNNILLSYPDKLEEYKKGKVNLLNFFFGEYLKRIIDKNVDKDRLKEDIKIRL